MDKYDITAILCLIILCIFIGYLNGTKHIQLEAIKYHHAYYHPTTGDVTWKKECVK